MTVSDLERRDVMGQNFLADHHRYARTIWPRMTYFGVGNTGGRSVFLWVSHVPINTGRGSSVPQKLGPYVRSNRLTLERRNLVW